MRAPIAFGRNMQGMTMMDLLIGILIALLGMMIMFDSLVTTQRQARTLAGATDAQNNAWQGLYSIERDVRAAGYGLNVASALGCSTRAGPTGFSNFVLAPVVITPGATAALPATITVTSGSSATPLGFTKPLADTVATSLTVANRFGIQWKDYLVLADPGQDCTLAYVSTMPPAAAPASVVVTADAGVTYAAATARVLNLGPAPVNNIYSVQNSQLVVRNNLSTVPAAAIASNVVGLAAQYGKDDGSGGGIAGDGIVDAYNTVAPVTAQDWSRVIAVRMAIVVRSDSMDKPDGAGNCTTTTAQPTWQGGAFDITGIPSWRCFRYRVFETTAPVRNMIWTL